MKNTLLFSALLHCTLLIANCQLSMAQSPQGFSFQSVIRDASNDLVVSSPVGMKISLLQGSASGTVVYAETHTPTTNANGLASITVGSGSVQSGTFATINWGAGPYFIKSETDPNGGTSYTITGTQQLMSVPYALYAGSTASDDWANSGNNINSANSGNVGVGTTTPTAKLHLNGPMKVDGANTVEFGAGVSGKQQDAGKIGYATFSDALDIVGAGSSNARKIKFWNDGGAGFTGNVGIGTTNPAAKLIITSNDAELLRVGTPAASGSIDQTHYNGGDPFIGAVGHWQSFLVSTSGMLSVRCINGNVKPLTAQLYQGTGIGGTLVETLTNVTPPLISFSTPVVGGQTYTLYFPSGPPDPWNLWNYSAGGSYANGTSDLGGDFFLETAIAAVPPMVVIKNTGNMGVGTFSPTARLHVQGNLRLVNGSQGDGRLLVSDADGLATWQDASAIVGGSWTQSGTDIHNSNSGNVGIGMASPTAKLHLDGTMKVESASTIEFGAGVVGKQQDAGKIGYAAFSDALDIVGAGNGALTRKLKFWNEGGAHFTGNVGFGGVTSPQRSIHVASAMRLQPQPTAPSSPAEGDMYMNSSTHKLMVYDGTTWQACW